MGLQYENGESVAYFDNIGDNSDKLIYADGVQDSLQIREIRLCERGIRQQREQDIYRSVYQYRTGDFIREYASSGGGRAGRSDKLASLGKLLRVGQWMVYGNRHHHCDDHVHQCVECPDRPFGFCSH